MSGSRQTRTGSQLPLNIAIIGTGGGAMAAAITAERGAYAAARTWTATHPGTQVISLEQGFVLGRMKNEWQFGPGP